MLTPALKVILTRPAAALLTGTPLGNMTGNGGLASGFDGVTIQAAAAGPGLASAADGTCGLDFGTAKTVSSGFAYASSNFDFAAANTTQVHLEYSDDNAAWSTAASSANKVWANSEAWNPTGVASGSHQYWRYRIVSVGDKRSAEFQFIGL